jgi:hypothetical protein
MGHGGIVAGKAGLPRSARSVASGPIQTYNPAVGGRSMAAIRTALRCGIPARLGVLLLSVATAGPVLAQPPDTVAPNVWGGGIAPPAGTLVAPGESPQVTFLHTGYVVGFIEPCG